MVKELGLIDPFVLSKRLAACPGVVESVSAYESVAVYVDPTIFTLGQFEDALSSLPSLIDGEAGKTIEIPVAYELGLDFENVCRLLGLSKDEFIRLHSGVEYRCCAIGFSPGFPYLGYLPRELSGLGRMPEPRVRVPAGSIGITGNQTGIYPQDTPGGWHLIGQTPCVIANIEDAFFPISAGDIVRFVPISVEEFGRLEGTRL